MKHIQESIIGRKNTNPTQLWLLYPVNIDYQDAKHLIPKQCMIYYDYVVLFCVDRQQLKEYFSFDHPKFTDSESELFEINSRYLKNFEDVEKWLGQIPPTEFDSIYTTNELNKIFDIPKYIKRL